LKKEIIIRHFVIASASIMLFLFDLDGFEIMYCRRYDCSAVFMSHHRALESECMYFS